MNWNLFSPEQLAAIIGATAGGIVLILHPVLNYFSNRTVQIRKERKDDLAQLRKDVKDCKDEIEKAKTEASEWYSRFLKAMVVVARFQRLLIQAGVPIPQDLLDDLQALDEVKG